ncbi:tRNA pseudouridine38-40 synthase [Persephonella hydrogeniphila]|uniref:tRNA pseudouridine synthase A n=1 Tax=Persephonella hydrogeniphila TaxID=198703 RepID=A0A285NIF1_9AQUI|nr:tRNA pseudouridine(38-40) synthase TruA [Persephonella hydrogeniphila]SNZ09048.1 tRNA pseudouridine38-40 synthase [Persephonella hydrogeniphila]
MKKNHNYKLTIKYIGTRYHGWQRQPNHITVQQVIEDCLKELFKEKITLIASGRTDAGVHALGQVANFKTFSYRKPFEIYKYLNATLPRDIGIVSVEEVPLSFNARFSAKGKTYFYRIYTKPDPFLYGFGWYVSKRFDIKKMEEALELIRGYKDLKSLAKKGDYLREDIDIRELFLKFDGKIIEIHITASHFLRYMVRKIVGHTVRVGTGSLSINQLKEILDASDPNKGIYIAPPEGLFLKEVYY